MVDRRGWFGCCGRYSAAARSETGWGVGSFTRQSRQRRRRTRRWRPHRVGRDQRRRRAHRAQAGLRRLCRQRPTTRRGRGPGLSQAARSGHQHRVDVDHQPGVPPSYFATEWRDQLAAAAQGGDASFYASGIFPGFASDQLALLMTTQSKKIRTLTATEIALNDHYPVADVMINGMGFARPLDFEPMLKTPGFIEIAWKAPIHLIADGLGVEVEEIRGSLDRELTDRDIEVAFGTIPAGTCGAVRTRAAGVVNGREAIVIEHIIRMARDVAPEWPRSESDATYRVDIIGDPDIHCELTLGEAEGHGAGRAAMTSTAMRVVNAIAYVVHAPAGLLSSLDIPMTLPRHAFD